VEFNSVVREYKNGNKWVRIGAWIFAVGLTFLMACVGGLLYLWLTDFPVEGVACPSWIVASLLVGMLYMVIGVCCVFFGMEPPSGGGKRKRKKTSVAAPAGALVA
jgi:hypothetical protein